MHLQRGNSPLQARGPVWLKPSLHVHLKVPGRFVQRADQGHIRMAHSLSSKQIEQEFQIKRVTIK